MDAMTTERCLFRKNREKDEFNDLKLKTLSGVEVVLCPTQQGKAVSLDGVQPLKLKKQAKVMIIQNIDVAKKLTNGALATVMGWKAVVEGDSQQMRIVAVTVQLDYDGSVHDIRRKRMRASGGLREGYYQFPLCLAYGITIHKVQGCTFKEPYAIKCGIMKEPSLLYVALSRATRLSDIHLHHFDKLRMPFPKSVPWKQLSTICAASKVYTSSTHAYMVDISNGLTPAQPCSATERVSKEHAVSVYGWTLCDSRQTVSLDTFSHLKVTTFEDNSLVRIRKGILQMRLPSGRVLYLT